MGAPVLTDGVVRLDGHQLADVAAHLEGEDDATAWWFGWWPASSTEDSVREAIQGWQQQWRTCGAVRTFAVRRLDTGQLAGGCQLRLRGDDTGLVSYWTAIGHRGRGFAARALRLLCQYARDTAGVHMVEAHVHPDNVASLRAARRAGFVYAADYTNHRVPMRRLVAHQS